jgi:Adenylate and Guanylate cyclase catalytic domain
VGFHTPSGVAVMYEAFDRICQKYGMNRMNSIGDSYVVVSGRSEREAKDHAVSMIQFIVACQNKVHELREKSVQSIDGNARRLPLMRWSIHSGSTAESLSDTVKMTSFLGRYVLSRGFWLKITTQLTFYKSELVYGVSAMCQSRQ